MKKYYKKLVFYMFGLGFTLSALFALVVWIVDPLRVFHKPFFCKEQIFEDMRFNAHWIINEPEIDSLILGESTFLNTSAGQASTLLGGKFFNLSALGNTMFERSLILEYAFKHKNIKNILYSFDDSGDLKTRFPTSQYDFLYDENKLNDYKVYLNTKFFASIFKFKCQAADFDMPRPFRPQYHNTTGIKGWEARAKKSIALSLSKPDDLSEPKIDESALQRSFENTENYLLKFARAHPDTQFYVVLSPSALGAGLEYKKNKSGFYRKKYLIEYVLKQNLSNVKFFAFDNMPLANDLSNFIDTGHFTKELSASMIEIIAKNEGLLNEQNFELWWKEYENNAKSYDFATITDEVMKFIDY